MAIPKDDSFTTNLTRRKFLIASATPLLAGAEMNDSPHNAMGERIGEVTDRSAIIHTRLTAAPARNNQGHRFPGVTRKTPIKDLPRMPRGMRVEELEGACPGKAGRVRLLYGARADLKGARQTAWAEAKPEKDFTRQFRLDDLQPGAKYFYAVEMRSLDGGQMEIDLRDWARIPRAGHPFFQWRDRWHAWNPMRKV
jgi:phosphodiesterase/alkaline phosphatase D-like protein